MMATNAAFSDWPGLLSLASFGALGVLGGVMLTRFRGAEADRQQLALARELQERLLPPPLFEGEGFRITARGPNARIPKALPALLEGVSENGSVDAHAIQPFYTGLLARTCGMNVTLAPEGETIVLTAR